MKRAYAVIDLKQYHRNLLQIRSKLASTTKLMAIVKADGYGHGAVHMARTAVQSQADYLGVAWLSEAVDLRTNGIQTPILLLSEPVRDFSTEIVGMNITQTVYTKSLIDSLNEKAKFFNKKAKVHIKVDTGMGRIGCHPNHVIEIIKKIQQCKYLELEGIFTHFANADRTDLDATEHQFKIFQKVLHLIESTGIKIPMKHAANSDAFHNYPQTHLDIVRVGLASYQQVLTIKSYVGYLKRVPANTSISYGSEYTTQKETTIATIMIGYADGFPRELGNKGHVLIRGKRFPIVGRVCMDMLMADIGDDPTINMGDDVVLIGKQENESITIPELCKTSHQIPYEIMCGISKRVPREYI